MRIDEQTQVAAARFAHELAGPWGAVGQAQELMEQKIAGLLSPAEQKLLQAGLQAHLLPVKKVVPTPRSATLPPMIARKLETAVGKNPAMKKLTQGQGVRALERSLKIFEIGYAAKCSRLALSSGQQIIRNLRSLGDFTRADLVQKTLVEETLQIAWMLVAGKNLSLHWRCGRLPAIQANPHALTQVWANLFSNAALVNPKGSQITVTTKAQTKTICIEIANSGAPLPAGLKLFEKGQTKRKGGRGLGLHLCHQIITAHGGRIAARNSTDKDLPGVVFTITLPRR